MCEVAAATARRLGGCELCGERARVEVSEFTQAVFTRRGVFASPMLIVSAERLSAAVYEYCLICRCVKCRLLPRRRLMKFTSKISRFLETNNVHRIPSLMFGTSLCKF